MRFIDIYDRLIANDNTIYEEIVRRFYSEWVVLVVSILWDREETDDVIQMAMLKFYQIVQERKIRKDSTIVQVYLRTLVRNEAINRLHHLKRWSKRLYGYLKFKSKSVTPYEALATSERDRVLLKQIGKLPQRQRQCCYLYYVWDMTSANIAEQLEMSDSSVRKHLSLGRRRLVKLLLPELKEAEL